MLYYLLAVVVITLCTYFIYHLREYFKTQERLKWLKEVPGWPVIGSALEFGDNSSILYDFQRLINEHGKMILLNIFMEPGIATTDYDFTEFILGRQEVLDKSNDYRFLHKWLGTGLLTSGGEKWKKRRRLTTPAFHFSILESFIDVFEKNLEILMSDLEKEIGKDIDIYNFINLYALDVICETAMGVSVNAQKDKKSNYVKNVKEMLRIFTEKAFSFIKGNSVLYALCPDFYKEIRILKELHSATNSVIDARRREIELKTEKKDDVEDDVGRKKRFAFLDILLRSTVDGKPLSTEDIREEVDTFMFEGHDTVSSAISFTLYLLATHPDVQKRAFREQREIFEDDIDRKSTYNDLQNMKYLETVIKESLRLYPSVPIFGRKPTNDVEYKGNIIPKGINISIIAFAILRDPDNFENPEKFDPDRFENNDGTRPYSFIPFSAGPRNCIGQKFAMLEMKTSLSRILRTYRLLPPETEQKMVLVSEAVLKSKNGIKLKVEKRKC